MADSKNKTKDMMKRRIILLRNLLIERSDEEHPLSTFEILDYLEEQGVPTNRKTLKSDLDTLEGTGLDIVKVASKPNRYFVGSRTFELPELKLLIDAVSSSRFITQKKSRELGKKLSGLASANQKQELRRHLYAVSGRFKPSNESIYYTVNDINDAINRHRKISFRYYEYDGRKNKVFRNDGNPYELSPYALFWNDDFYYVVGYSREHDNISSFRVDRISGVEILKERAVKKPENYSIDDYSNRIFEMFGGDNVKVRLLCRNELMKYVIDRFGEDVETKPVDDDSFSAHIEVALSPNFYAWVFRFGGGIRILSPQRAVTELEKMAKALLID